MLLKSKLYENQSLVMSEVTEFLLGIQAVRGKPHAFWRGKGGVGEERDGD